MRIITANLNGIRSAARKGFYDWLPKQKADVVCLQELKAQEDQLTDDVFSPKGYFRYLHTAEKKGYSGVGIYTPHEPDKITEGIGWADFDSEGRFIQADFGKLSVVSVYIPSGTSSQERLDIKLAYLERMKEIFKSCRRKRREYIFCGDWNIAHKNIDLRNWRSNQKNSGFLPEERAWLDWLYDDAGFIDVFRTVDDREEQYTWWSNRGQSWAKNVGWRLDLQVATPKIAQTARAVHIYKDERFSDHAPLIIDYNHDI